MTGEDVLFYFNIVHGGSGGILAAAHVRTDRFVKIYNLVQKNDHQGALGVWNQLSRFIPLLFKEPNPAPIKYILAKKQLIRSAEVRQPLAPISEGLRNTFDRLIAENAL
jgi:4-hydroxy-tetrahydrodipicolinate synthase